MLPAGRLHCRQANSPILARGNALTDYVERLDMIGHSDLTQLYSLDTVERQHRLAEIQSLLETCLQYGMEKERIAAQTYEMVRCRDL